MSLAKWLSTVKEQYNPGWTVVMGNEAGDLDSIASSIAYAWIQSTVHARPSIPLLRLTPPDLALRKENTHALALAAIPHSSLLFAPDFRPSPNPTFALVDHNRLAPEFAHQSHVLAVVDHHADEGLYPDAAPRLVAPAGSCASHIATLCPPDLPPELATLLLCAIAIDTGGARPGGKALAVDHAAVQFLAPRSTFAAAPGPGGLLPADGWLQELTAALDEKKADVAALGAHDLLRRDYKQYTLRPADPIETGLASVPLPLAAWAPDGRLAGCAARFMGERGLRVLGVLTSFRDAGGKHRREQLWLVCADARAEAEALWAGLEASAELALKRDEELELGVAVDGLAVRVYRQKNSHATRKVTAPLLRAVFE